MNHSYCIQSIDNLQNYSDTQEYDTVIDLFERIQSSDEFFKNPSFKLMIIKEKASYYARIGENDACKDLIKLGFNILNSIDDDHISNIQVNNDYFSRYNECESALLSLQGRLNYYNGNIDLALDNFKSAHQLRLKLNNHANIASSLNQIGIVYYAKGHLTESLEYFKKSLINYSVDGYSRSNTREIAYIYNNIGNIFADQRKMNEALDMYNKSMEYLEKIGFPLDIATAIENICILMIENKLSGVERFLDKLSVIYKNNPDNKHLELNYKYTNAVYLKSSIRIKDKVKALELFEYIISDLDFDTELTYPSIKHTIELLLSEYKFYKEQIVLEEISVLLEKLLILGQNQQSSRIIVEALILKAQLSVLTSENITVAKQLLNQAEIMAEEKDLDHLAIIVSNTFDSLLSYETHDGFIDEIEDTISKFTSSNLEDMTTEEIPLLFLIIERNKTCIYSITFQDNNKYRSDLIANYLLALDIFNQEAFSTSGSLERIKHEDHTIILRYNDLFMYCYAFKGSSYSANKRLDKLIENIITSKILDGIKNITILKKCQIDRIEDLVNNMFFESDKE